MIETQILGGVCRRSRLMVCVQHLLLCETLIACHDPQIPCHLLQDLNIYFMFPGLVAATVAGHVGWDNCGAGAVTGQGQWFGNRVSNCDRTWQETCRTCYLEQDSNWGTGQ